MFKDLCDFINNHLIKDRSSNLYFKGRICKRYLEKHFPSFFTEIIERTSFLPKEAILLERVYCIINQLAERPSCKCGKEVKFQKQQRRYAYFCNRKCKYAIQLLHFNNKKYCLETLGVEYPLLNVNLKKKREETFLKKYGGHPSRNKQVIEKRKKTCQMKYNGNAPMCDSRVKLKTSETVKRKYNTTCVLTLPENQEKARTTFITKKARDKIKRSWNSKSKEELKRVVNSRERTNCNKYGAKYYTASVKGIEEARSREQLKIKSGQKGLEIEKGRQTSILKWGRESFSQRHLKDSVYRLRQDRVRYKKLLKYLNTNRRYRLEVIGSILGMDPTSISNDFKNLGVEPLRCYPLSAIQKEVYTFIKSITDEEVVSNDWKALTDLELDIYLPSRRLALEVDGIYYHSYGSLPKLDERLKHYNKTKKCRELGIKLIRVNELDWRDPVRNNILKSMIRNSLGSLKVKLNAREGTVSVVTTETADKFYDHNHIQGRGTYSRTYGLVIGGQLVSCMSFKRLGVYKWELSRFATLTETSVRGAASKLLSTFEREVEWDSIQTFADLRYSYGALYKNLQFEECKDEIPVSYYYTDRKKVYHKSNFRKKNLKTLLKAQYNEALTEFELIFKYTKLRVLFDSGKLKFIKNNSLPE